MKLRLWCSCAGTRMYLELMASPHSLRILPSTTTLSGITIIQSVKLTWGQASPALVGWTRALVLLPGTVFQLLQLERDMQVSEREVAIYRLMIRGVQSFNRGEKQRKKRTDRTRKEV